MIKKYIDKIKERGIKSYLHFVPTQTLIAIIFFILFCFDALYLFRYDTYQESFVLGDWLVNYEDGGFKRRGLSGSFFFLIQDLTGISLIYLVFFVQLFFCTLFYVSFYNLLKNKNIPLFYFILLFSPIAMFFHLSELITVGRKEIIFIALFSLMAFWQNKKSFTRLKRIFIILSLFVFTFWHELLLFYITYFILLELLFYNYSEKGYFNLVKTTATYLLAVLIPAGLIFLFGSEINNGKSIEILQQRGLLLIKGGIFEYNTNSFETIKNEINNYLWYLVPFFYGLALVFIILKKQNNLKLFYLFLLCIFFSIPIFFLAVDWGRWIYIHFTFILILMGSLLAEKNKNEDKINLFSMKDTFILILFLLINLSFRMPICNFGLNIGCYPIERLNKIISFLL